MGLQKMPTNFERFLFPESTLANMGSVYQAFEKS